MNSEKVYRLIYFKIKYANFSILFILKLLFYHLLLMKKVIMTDTLIVKQYSRPFDLISKRFLMILKELLPRKVFYKGI